MNAATLRASSGEAQTIELTFEAGVPVALDGERLGLVELIDKAAEIGMRHGVGIVDHIEDRIVGLKVRDIYEVPAAAIILKAHKELERLTGTIHQNQFKPGLDQKWAYLVYAGLWWEPLREDLEAYIEHVNRRVTGTIGLKLFKGSVRVVTRESANAVYDAQLATFAESGGLFSQSASPVMRFEFFHLLGTVIEGVEVRAEQHPWRLGQGRARWQRDANGPARSRRAVGAQSGVAAEPGVVPAGRSVIRTSAHAPCAGDVLPIAIGDIMAKEATRPAGAPGAGSSPRAARVARRCPAPGSIAGSRAR